MGAYCICPVVIGHVQPVPTKEFCHQSGHWKEDKVKDENFRFYPENRNSKNEYQ